MSESDVLLTIAEVAVAFAGFASLVGVLGQRTSADDPRVIGVRMRGIIPTLLFTAVTLIALVIVNVFLATPALYRTALALLLFQSGFAFSLIVFSFLPRVHPAGGGPG